MPSQTRSKRRAPDAASSAPKRRRAAPLNERPTDLKNVLVMGTGLNGQLGLGQHMEDTVATAPRMCLYTASEVVQVAVGNNHCAALTINGDLLTWGINDTDALGREAFVQNTFDPLKADRLSRLGISPTEVAVTDHATFVVTEDGSVYGWGTFFNDNEAFGFLNARPPRTRRHTRDQFSQWRPVQVPHLFNIKHLSAGANHVLALTHTGKVLAWGCGPNGELGRRIMSRHPDHSLGPRPVRLPRCGAASIHAGAHHNFVVDKLGRTWAWGLNNYGQTCLPCTDTFSAADNVVDAPRMVPKLLNFDINDIAGGLHHSLACTTDGDILSWGRCDNGQAGALDVPLRSIMYDEHEVARVLKDPLLISGMDALSVSAGEDDSFFISNSGNRVYAWGRGEDYRTGLLTEDTYFKPKLIRSNEMSNIRFSSVGCGSTFTVIAGPSGEVSPPPPSVSPSPAPTESNTNRETSVTNQDSSTHQDTSANAGTSANEASPAVKEETSPPVKTAPVQTEASGPSQGRKSRSPGFDVNDSNQSIFSNSAIRYVMAERDANDALEPHSPTESEKAELDARHAEEDDDV